jgi:hypothetical protein
VVLQLARIHLVLRVVGWVLVQVWEEDGLAVGGLDVFATAAVPVSACADLVVEGAVYFVGFCAEDAREVVGHCEVGEVEVGEGDAEKSGGFEEGCAERKPCAWRRNSW